MQKIQVGDKVKVVAGKDKGREGVVEKVIPSKGKVIVPEMNVYKKHVKGFQGQKGGIYDVSRPLDVAKVQLICPSCKKITRVGFKMAKDEKYRVCRKCGKTITNSTKAKK